VPSPSRPTWRLVVLLLVGVVAAGVVWAAWGPVHRLIDPEPAAEASLDCMPVPPFDTVAEANRLIRTYRSQPGFVGGDVGADLTLSDGRRMWVFGDTLRDQTFDGPQIVRNSMLIFEDDCAGVVLPADGGALIPDRVDGVGYWPMSLGKVARDDADLVGVGVQRVRATGAGTLSFQILGPGIAVFRVLPGETPELLAVHDLGPDTVDRTRPMWGAAAAVVGDLVYLYGTAHPAAGMVFGNSLHVARAPIGDLADPAKWEYWTGHRWGHDPDRIGTLIPARGGVSQVLSVFQENGSWYAVSKRGDLLGTDLVVWKAPGPTGPFVAGPVVASIPTDPKSGLMRYMPLAHPDLPAPPGRVVVSYSVNINGYTNLMKNPFRYRPVFLTVPLP